MYLPDDFGHSPALPSLLRALGFTYAAVTRIDGIREDSGLVEIEAEILP